MKFKEVKQYGGVTTPSGCVGLKIADDKIFCYGKHSFYTMKMNPEEDVNVAKLSREYKENWFANYLLYELLNFHGITIGEAKHKDFSTMGDGKYKRFFEFYTWGEDDEEAFKQSAIELGKLLNYSNATRVKKDVEMFLANYGYRIERN